jgi:hypothetical protein
VASSSRCTDGQPGWSTTTAVALTRCAASYGSGADVSRTARCPGSNREILAAGSRARVERRLRHLNRKTTHSPTQSRKTQR